MTRQYSITTNEPFNIFNHVRMVFSDQLSPENFCQLLPHMWRLVQADAARHGKRLVRNALDESDFVACTATVLTTHMMIDGHYGVDCSRAYDKGLLTITHNDPMCDDFVERTVTPDDAEVVMMWLGEPMGGKVQLCHVIHPGIGRPVNGFYTLDTDTGIATYHGSTTHD